MKYVNLTPHAIVLNDGTINEASGNVARVSTSYTEVAPGMFKQVYGEIVGLPEPEQGSLFIVSGKVKDATLREDVIAPATGHPNVVRNEQGHVVSVPGFII